MAELWGIKEKEDFNALVFVRLPNNSLDVKQADQAQDQPFCKAFYNYCQLLLQLYVRCTPFSTRALPRTISNC